MKWRPQAKFWMARLAFLAVCAFLTASTLNLWLGNKISRSISSQESAKQLPPPAINHSPKQRDFASASDRNIFGGRRERISLLEIAEGEGESGNWEEATLSSIGARLIATAVFLNPVYSLATIESGGEPRSYSINDCPSDVMRVDPLFAEIIGPSVNEPLVPCNRLMGFAVIKRIEEQRVIVYNERDRRYEYIPLQEGFVPQPPSRRVMEPVSGGAAGSTLRKLGANKYEIDAKDFDSTMGNLSAIATQARIVPAFDESGKSIGFKLLNVVPDSIYTKVGLQDGDIITKINGYEINSPDKALELYQMRSTAKQLNIDFKRDGVSKTADVSISGRPQ